MQGSLESPALWPGGVRMTPCTLLCPKGMGSAHPPCRAWVVAGRASLLIPDSCHLELIMTFEPGVHEEAEGTPELDYHLSK